MAEATLRRQQLRTFVGLGALYTAFFGLAFAISAYYTFPYERLRDFLISKIEGRSKGSDALQVEIGDLQPSFFTGAVLKDVDLKRRASEADAEPSTLHFDEISARVSLWSLIVHAPKVALHAKIGEGDLDGSFAVDGDAQIVVADLDAVDVERFGLGSFLGVPLKGRASGKVDLNMPAEVAKTTGDFELKIAGLRIGDGKAKLSMPGLRSGMTLEEVDAGTLDLAIKAQNGAAEIVRMSADGKDLKLHGEGSIRLSSPMRRSRPDVQLELKLSDAYKNKTDRTKALFEILAMNPDWQRATGADGALNLHVAGTLQSPRATPGGSRSAAKKR